MKARNSKELAMQTYEDALLTIKAYRKVAPETCDPYVGPETLDP